MYPCWLTDLWIDLYDSFQNKCAFLSNVVKEHCLLQLYHKGRHELPIKSVSLNDKIGNEEVYRGKWNLNMSF